MTALYKVFAYGMATCLIVLGTGASAHVNWFVEGDAEPLPNIAVTNPIFLFWTVLAAVMVAFSIWIDGKLPTPRIVQSKLRHDFMEILRVFTGMSFLLTAYEGALIAPHKVAEAGFGLALVVLQAVIGLMLIANRWIKYAALMMLALHAGVAWKFGLLPALEYAIVIGIAFFLLFNAFEDEDRRNLFKPYSVDTLRIWTGVSLVALAVGEKLAPSALGQVFVSEYQWNFMAALGVPFFDDRIFVLSAGMVEAVIGIVLILGTTVRLAVLALSIMMAISNIVFILQGNNEAALVEFIGHMPIIGVALLLLLLGYGQKLRITDLRIFGNAPKPQGAEAS
ncbi:hypothetical protein FIU97_02910 [Roseivivax sp. THAF40]|uniref:hypothetical protein n=1 Tax=unclassified Roseivivax TaxID=2639302 RepID=UPI001267F925|nr:MULTISPECIES: hypothetical protein [unclassified Roseivivax]QFS81716.1 hypothetical protein FIV09_02650 [Roseivivax sp. THAF197b]QFT45516.1 hypothetical protein FIU97_02910 [Roseivivax sp. THAF40]